MFTTFKRLAFSSGTLRSPF